MNSTHTHTFTHDSRERFAKLYLWLFECVLRTRLWDEEMELQLAIFSWFFCFFWNFCFLMFFVSCTLVREFQHRHIHAYIFFFRSAIQTPGEKSNFCWQIEVITDWCWIMFSRFSIYTSTASTWYTHQQQQCCKYLNQAVKTLFLCSARRYAHAATAIDIAKEKERKNEPE